MDPRLVHLARRVEPLLYVAAALLALDALTSVGLGRLISGPAAAALTLMLLLHRFAGVPGHALLRWVAVAVGGLMLLGGLAVLAVGIWFFALGSFGILGGLVAVPVALGLGGSGYALLSSALAGPRPGAPRQGPSHGPPSEAVRRFDELHRPGGPSTRSPAGPGVDAGPP